MRVGVIHYNSHAIFDRLEFFTPRCKFCQLFIRHIFTWPMLQQKFEISVNIQVVCFCHLNHCVDYRTGIRSVHGTAEQPVLPSYCKWTDCILAELSSYMNKHPRMQSDHLQLVEKTGCSVPVQKELLPVPLCILWLRWQKQMIWTLINIWHIYCHSGQMIKCQMNSWNNSPRGARLWKLTVKTKIEENACIYHFGASVIYE